MKARKKPHLADYGEAITAQNMEEALKLCKWVGGILLSLFIIIITFIIFPFLYSSSFFVSLSLFLPFFLLLFFDLGKDLRSIYFVIHDIFTKNKSALTDAKLKKKATNGEEEKEEEEEGDEIPQQEEPHSSFTEIL